MITSALIAQCRREYEDNPQTLRVSRAGDGTVNIFNTGKFPILEGSYIVRVSGNVLTENSVSGYTINLDNGDVFLQNAPANGVIVQVDLQHVTWRDQHWLEAINGGVSNLNARGFFKQVVREAIAISGSVRSFNAPSGAVDAYELLYTPAPGANPIKLPINWSYQQDANKIVLGATTTRNLSGFVSYLRDLKTFSTTSATLDASNDWIEILRKKAGANYFRSLAGKIARAGNVTIDEGHFSFSNLRAQASDLNDEFDKFATRKKPTRPAKDIQFNIDNGGHV